MLFPCILHKWEKEQYSIGMCKQQEWLRRFTADRLIIANLQQNDGRWRHVGMCRSKLPFRQNNQINHRKKQKHTFPSANHQPHFPSSPLFFWQRRQYWLMTWFYNNIMGWSFHLTHPSPLLIIRHPICIFGKEFVYGSELNINFCVMDGGAIGKLFQFVNKFVINRKKMNKKWQMKFSNSARCEESNEYTSIILLNDNMSC